MRLHFLSSFITFIFQTEVIFISIPEKNWDGRKKEQTAENLPGTYRDEINAVHVLLVQDILDHKYVPAFWQYAQQRCYEQVWKYPFRDNGREAGEDGEDEIHGKAEKKDKKDVL